MATNKALKISLYAFLFSVVFSGIGFFQAGLYNGELCYALDDSFIMMALAKNLAFHQVWGLTPYEFSSTASSPLFTVLLAFFFRIFGEKIWLPLILNLLSLLVFYYALARKSISWGLQPWQIWWILMGVFYFMPVPVLLFGSMEHLMHTLLAFWLLCICLEEDSPSLFQIALAGFLLGGIRFEGLFEVEILGLFFFYKKNWKAGLVLGISAAVPFALLGFVSVSKGWFFFPNSLILKAYGMNIQDTGSFWGFLKSWFSKASNNTHAMAAILVLYLLWAKKQFRTEKEKNWILVVMAMSVLHFCLARYNHVFRYEAYLLGLAWIVFFKQICQNPMFNSQKSILNFLRKNPYQLILILLLAFGPVYRSIYSFAVGTRAMTNIFEQQVQMARFIQANYPKEKVGVLDIGALAYYSEARVLDLWGLADMDFARLKLAYRYNPAQIDSICRKKDMWLAVVYGNDIDLADWEKVASWTIYKNSVCSQATISFICLDPRKKEKLLKNLKKFELSLPSKVVVKY